MIDKVVFGVLLFACILMSYGCWLVTHPAGFIVGGFLLATIAFLYLLETD